MKSRASTWNNPRRGSQAEVLSLTTINTPDNQLSRSRPPPTHTSQTLMKASTLVAANYQRKECVNSLRREKMAEVKGQKRLEGDLERGRAICATTTRATQQVGIVRQPKFGWVEGMRSQPCPPTELCSFGRAPSVCACAQCWREGCRFGRLKLLLGFNKPFNGLFSIDI